MGRKTKEHWTKFCADWNAKYPVGTAVVLKKDSGNEVTTKTRSTARISDAGYPVIFLEGVTGYYIMDRVTPVEQVNGDGDAKTT
jgi:hypothetical protein